VSIIYGANELMTKLMLERLNPKVILGDMQVVDGGKSFVSRAKIPGGWMVLLLRDHLWQGGFFIPDPEHKWDGNSLP
jgi:hypothetical protein